MASLTAERLDPWRWIAAPAVVCVILTLLFAAPIRVFGLQLPEPVFALVPAFAWAVLRPSILAPACLLLLGLFDDLLWGGRLGVWALGLLAAYGLVLTTRSMVSGQGRLAMAFSYLLACSAAMGVCAAAVVLETHNPPNILAVIGQWLPTVLLYPAADRLIERFEDSDPRFR